MNHSHLLTEANYASDVEPNILVLAALVRRIRFNLEKQPCLVTASFVALLPCH